MKEESRRKLDVQDIIVKHLDAVKQTIMQQMAFYKRNASFAHVDSLQIEAQSNYGALWGLYSFNYLETGSRPWSKRPPFVPRWFHNIIRQWIIDKGIPVTLIPYKTDRPHKYSVQERSLQMAAGAIAYNIMKKGTALYQTGIPQDLFSGAINRECEAIANEARLRLGAIIENIDKTM